MLLKRILTASIIAPIVVFGVLALSQTGFELSLALILIVGSWEYCNLIQINHLIGKALYASVVLIVTYFLNIEPSSLTIVLYAAAIWWLVALVWLFSFQKALGCLVKAF